MPAMIDPKTAWAAYKPSADNPWDLKKVGHLYRRASFGATWEELQTALQEGPQGAIDRLLQGGGDLAAFESTTKPLADSIRRANNGQQASAWWVYRMLYGPHPLREKLTLFWHNHFATSNAKVQNAGYMLGQYDLMYRHALGSFTDLLQEMSKDPAMLIWLDTNQSKKEMPNENYARELMELFSLGIGHYTEQDIREAARAFTGWSVRGGKAVFDPANHDSSDKTVLGQKGPWKGEDIVRICLEQKACAGFIVRKLFRMLISETIDPSNELIEPLATQFRESGYHFGKLVETMLRSNLFFSPLVYRTRIKSPVEFVIGIVRGMEGKVGASPVAEALETLGQNLLNPPSVKGWDGGTVWLNGQTLLFRQNLALALTSTEDIRFPGNRIDPARLAAAHGKKSDADIVDFFLQLFLQGDVPAESRQRLLDYVASAGKQKAPIYWTDDDKANHRIRTVCHLVLTLPEFQLD